MKRGQQVPFEFGTSILIRGRRWRIKRERDLGASARDKAAKRELRTCRGVCYPDKREIHLAVDYRPRAEASTLLHELLHACSRDRIPTRLEERFIADIERALLQALEQLKWRPKRRQRPSR